MTTPIPTVEPQILRAGETWQWRREDLAADYPANGGWTLKYALKNAAQHIEITAAADGASFAVTVGSTTTNPYVAGTYRMVGFVTDGGTPAQVFGIYDEEIIILPSYTGNAAVDDRSHARKVLDAIEAVIENRATKDQEEYTIGHRMLRHTALNDLYRFRQQYQSQVFAEEQKLKAARGQGGSKIVSRL